MNQSASDNRRISKSIHRKAAIVSPLPHKSLQGDLAGGQRGFLAGMNPVLKLRPISADTHFRALDFRLQLSFL
jgi:hypothetical protein